MLFRSCVGGYQFTHYVAWQGFMAVRNAFLPSGQSAVLDQVPWATFTDPELAHTGLTEAQAQSKFGQEAVVCNWPLDQVDRSLTRSTSIRHTLQPVCRLPHTSRFNNF